MNDSQISLIKAYEKGYRIINGEVISPSGKVRKTDLDTQGYKRFTIAIKDILNSKKIRRHRAIAVHRLVAYQKYGIYMFNPNIEVRHLDGNQLNNIETNIVIGTHVENMMDVPKYKRVEHAKIASKKIRKFTDDEMEIIKSFHNVRKSYKETMNIFNITSKGTLYRILNIKYKTNI